MVFFNLVNHESFKGNFKIDKITAMPLHYTRFEIYKIKAMTLHYTRFNTDRTEVQQNISTVFTGRDSTGCLVSQHSKEIC